MLSDSRVAFVHIHNAKHGCYAALATRPTEFDPVGAVEPRITYVLQGCEPASIDLELCYFTIIKGADMNIPGADHIILCVCDVERSLDINTRISWDRYGWLDRPDTRLGDA